jgi:DNA-binding response OmpR family regulator
MKFKDLYELSKNFTVLYVEDDAGFKAEFTPILENFFTRIDVAEDGKEALKQYKNYFKEHQKYYDIVITDVEMPHLNGVELTQLLYEEYEEQIIVVISAYNTPEYLMQFVNIGIEHFLLKPFDLEAIFEIFYKICMKHASRSPEKQHNITKLKKDLYWDGDKLRLYYAGKNINLTKKEILFLEALIKNGNEVTRFNEIYCALWGDEQHLATQQNLNPLLSRLKKKLPKNTIKSVYGIGYILEI